MEIHQVLHVASPGDAVTNSAIEYRQILREVTPSEIYAAHVDPRLRGDVLPLTAYLGTASGRAGRNVLLYHLSTGSPEVMSFLLGRSETLGVIYHNVTPAHFFEQYDERVTAELRRGRDDLARLRDRASFAMADSEYNGRELEECGYQNVTVVPLLVDVTKLASTTPDPSLAKNLDALPGPMLLFVGQLQPHKRPDFLLAAHHVLTTYLVPDAHLALVGAGRVRGYEAAIGRYCRELNLRATLAGWVTAEELAAFYRRSTLFVTASEHEGFCVPVLEAMSFDMPVIARAYGALPDTVGDAGIVLDPDDGPEVMAEAIAAVLGDDALRTDLVGRGRARIAAADPALSAEAFLRGLVGVV